MTNRFLVSATAVVALGIGLAISVVPLLVGADESQSSTFGGLPTQRFSDGTTGVDPNALGIGAGGVTTKEPLPADELRDTLARIPAERKLTLAGGTVIAVAGVCSFPEDYDPTKKCVGIHDIEGQSVITLDPSGSVIGISDRASASTARLRDLIEEAVIRETILEFLSKAPTE